MKYLPIYLVAGAISIVSCKKEPTLEEKARVIHENVLTLDTHNDINVANFTDSINYTQDLDNQVTLPKMKKGGLDVSWFIVYTGQGDLDSIGYAKAYDNAISKFNAIHKLTKEIAPDDIELAVTSEQAHEINARGKKVAMIGIENGYPIGTDVSRVKEFYDLGARYMSLSHNGHSQLCDSNTGEADNLWLHDGVSPLGEEVIKEMNYWGIMIDVSHPSKESMRDMIALTKAPLIASHSSARALCDHSRNLDDEQLQWIKENGGVVQTVAFRTYINAEKSSKFRADRQALVEQIAKDENFELYSRNEVRAMNSEDQNNYIAKYREIMAEAESKMVDSDPVNVADFVDHIDYLVSKIGIEHVGISSDFDGGGGVEGWNDASETFNVTLELVKRGYTEKEISMLWSDNLLRVLDDVQQTAQELQAQNKA